ncbi:hypothetical protein FRC02_002425, partial [Tulasnella sp. 418]
MSNDNGLLCFTNCFLALEDGKLHERDLWIDTNTGLIVDAQTQERSLYPKLLRLLQPRRYPNSANLLGWHVEGPFLQPAKRGAHDPNLLLSSVPEGLATFDEIYALSKNKESDNCVKIITAAPELNGVLNSIEGLVKERGITFSIGHSIANSSVAVRAVQKGARLITHLFNAMPQLHHRDPAIIGLLGAGGGRRQKGQEGIMEFVQGKVARELGKIPPSEALAEVLTPPGTPMTESYVSALIKEQDLSLEEFKRPYYGIIVDGIHSHPHSVRLAYTAHPKGCILITDAMSMLDPHLPDGVHDWRDGRQILKDGDRLFIAGTDTLAGSVITLDKCVRNFSSFTGASLAESLLAATLHPAKCLKIDDRKGLLKGGRDADLTIWDKETEEVIG